MRLLNAGAVLLLAAGAMGVPAATGIGVPVATGLPGACSPAVMAVGYSDALDKTSVAGNRVGGLSALAYDAGTGRYLALPDHLPTAAVVWPLAGLDDLPVAQPRVAGPPIRLRTAAGGPVPGNADNEGLAVLRGGLLAISSETGPAISIFDRDGSWRSDVTVPPWFRTAPRGRAAPNAGLEGLTANSSGDRLIAAMEKPLIGDDPDTVRMLDYRRTAAGGFVLNRELRYRPAPGMRVADIAAYASDRVLVLEGAYSPRDGSSTVLATADVGPPTGHDRVRSLVRRPLADLARCPAMGATSKEWQRNRLLDNYEGIAVVSRGAGYTIHLLSDDNYSPRQTTRLLTLWARLP